MTNGSPEIQILTIKRCGRSHVNDGTTKHKSCFFFATLNGMGAVLWWQRQYNRGNCIGLSYSFRTSLWRLKWPSEETIGRKWFLNFQRGCSWKERNHMRVSWNGGTPIAEWFVRETPPKMDDNQGYPYFRTPSYIEPSLWHQLSRESQDHIVSTWKAGVAVQRWRAWCRCNFRMGKPSWMIGMRSWCFQILYV